MSPDQTSFAASDATQSAIGVAKWGVTVDATGGSTIHGYATNGDALVDVQQSFTAGTPSSGTLHVAVSGQHGSAQMTQTMTVAPDSANPANRDVTFQTIESTFPQSAEATAVLQLLRADAQTQAAAAPTPTTLVEPLHPMDGPPSLTAPGCFALTTTCDTKIALTVFNLTALTASCGFVLDTGIVALTCAAAAPETLGASLVCAGVSGAELGTTALACAGATVNLVDSSQAVHDTCFKGCSNGGQ